MSGSHTTFTNGVTLTDAGWFQDVDTVTYTLFGNGTTYTGALTLGASGNIAVNTNKFTVAASTGNTLVAGTLNVTGATTLSSALTYGGVTLSNAVTGTGNMVLSASPTLTGTLTAAIISSTDTTQSTSTSTGAIVTAGGVGIAKALQVGGTITGLGTFQSSSGADIVLNANGANRDIIGKVNGTEVFRLTGSTTTFTVTGPAATSLQAYNATGSTTARVFGTLQNTGGNHTWGVESSAGGQFFGASGAYDSIVQTASGTNLWLGVGTTGIAKVSSTGLSVTGTASATQSITAQGATTLATGAGVEVIYSAGQGYVQSYNRTGSAYTVLNVSGSTTNIQASGSTIGAFSSTGLSVTGTLSTTNSANSNAFTATQTSNNGNWAGIFVNSAATATNQYGVQITLSGDPNDATRNFLQGVGTVTERFTLRSNGGLANFSANNVNLSDLTVKPKFELYGEAGVMPSLWEAHKRMRGAWGRFKYDDQTHDDWNYGYGAQLVAEAFAHVAPELVDWWDDKKKLKAVYATDLANITGAIVTEVQYRVDYHEEKIAELLSWKAKAETALASAGITVE